MWSSIIGQSRIKRVLHAAWKAQRVSGAYLFYGPEGVGKDALAMEFAKLVNCESPSDAGSCGECGSCRRIATMQHPGVKFIHALPLGKSEDARKDDPLAKLDAATMEVLRDERDAKWVDPYAVITIPRANEIKLSSIRDIRKELSLSGGSGMRVVIVSRAEMMSDESQNALLKTLEEPPSRTVFILTTAFRDRLASTVRSRCQEMRCDPIDEDLVTAALIERDKMEPAIAALCAELGGGSYGLARTYADEKFSVARTRAVDFLRKIAIRDVPALYAAIEEIAHERDKALIEQFLLILLYWFRDAERLQSGAPVQSHSAAADEALRKFVNRYPSARCDAAVKHIEATARDVKRNANVFLALRVMAADLQKSFT